MRGRIGIILAATLVVGLSYLAGPAASRRASRPLCHDGRYVVASTVTLIKPASGPVPEFLDMTGGGMSLSSGCGAAPMKVKRTKRGTRVSAVWSSCQGVVGKVRIKAGIDSDCAHLWGTFKVHGAKAKMFDASASRCGDGVVDSGSGEQCDGSGCSAGFSCDTGCRCSQGRSGIVPVCGNGVKEGTEQCDGFDLGGATCPEGSAGGAFLSCTAECTIDNSHCATSTSTTIVTATTTTTSGGGGTTTTSTAPAGSSTTTTTPGGGSTTTTTPVGSTTSTSLVGGGTTSTSTSSSTSSSIPATTTTSTLPTLNHFKCYKTKPGIDFSPISMTLRDQFEHRSSSARKPLRFCNPVDKNGEGISDPTAHLMCYAIEQLPQNFVPREVVVRNQFGDQLLTVVKPESLCMPAEKNGTPSALDLSRFKCYRVRATSDAFASRVVTLSDQYETKDTTVIKPHLLCNPATIEDEDSVPIDGDDHLTCYKIKDVAGQAPFVPRPVTVVDDLATHNLKAIRGECRKVSLLCVPSLKNPGAATTSTTLVVSSTTSSTAPSTTTSSTSTTSSTTQFCGNNRREGTEQCDGTDLGGQTCPGGSANGAFLACHGDCTFDFSHCPGPTTTVITTSTTIHTTTSTSSSTSSTAPVVTTSTSTSSSTVTTTSTTMTTIGGSSCCGAQRITLVSTAGTLRVDNLAPFGFPPGVITTMDIGPATGAPGECKHDVVLPPGGFFVPHFDIPPLNYCSQVINLHCESGNGEGAGALWDGNGTPGVSMTNVTKTGDTSDGVCGVLGTGCNTLPGGAGADSLGDIDEVLTAAPGGGVRSVIDIRARSLTWSDSRCSPAVNPGCCVTSNYGDDTVANGELLITLFDFVLSPTTNTSTASFVDKNSDGCARAGSGFYTPLVNGPKSLTGVPAAGPCCVAGQATTVVTLGIGFSGGGPLYDLGFTNTIPNTVASCGTPGSASCTVTTDSCLK